MANVTFESVWKRFDEPSPCGTSRSRSTTGSSSCSSVRRLREEHRAPNAGGPRTQLRRQNSSRRSGHAQRRTRGAGCRDGFESYALYPDMTVYDNLAFVLRNQRDPKRQWTSACGARPTTCSSPSCRRKPERLLGGQRQRVAFGRAIVREPAAFLMDEPLSNLDGELRVETRSELLKLQRRLETTTIYVTDDQVEAMTMAIASR